MSRGSSEAIRRFILDQIEEHPRNIATVVSNTFSVSRVTANKYLRTLVAEGAISAKGNTRSRAYVMLPQKAISGTVDIDSDTQDDEIWRRYIRPALVAERQNIIDICAYGFTEIFNNVIDHSDSNKAYYSVELYPTLIKLVIGDAGIGIFEKIRSSFDLDDRREAILELSKGKLTSDPERHSGEGIFFSSRMFDSFVISSLDLSYVRVREDNNQWLLEIGSNEDELEGTSVTMEISRFAERTAKQVFDLYVDDNYRFSKTHVPILLAKIGEDQLVSRSQAKRVLARVEKFSEVCLDFSGVHSIGQGFADEIFRVFPRRHPEIVIVTFGVEDQVRVMIEHVMSYEAEENEPRQGHLF